MGCGTQALFLERQLVKKYVLIAATFMGLLPNLAHKDARAAEVKLLAAVGVREIITELGPQFESATGHKLLSSYSTRAAASCSGLPLVRCLTLSSSISPLSRD